MNTAYLSTTVQKALDILNVFKDQQKQYFTQIQEKTGFSKSTLFRLLYTLQVNDYLARDAHGRYMLGVNIFILGNSFPRHSQISRIATPLMKELSEKLGASIHLGILEGTNVVILNKIDPPNNIKMFARVGAEVPAHCTGQGKTLLAWSPKEEVETVINTKGMRRYTPHTITTMDGLFKELEIIRERGYTIDNSEHEKHIKCVAVPVLNDKGTAEAALSVTGLVLDFDGEEVIWKTAGMLKEVALKIQQQLGFCN